MRRAAYERLKLRLVKLREHRARLLAALALEGDGPNSTVGVLRERLLGHANSRIRRIEGALRPGRPAPWSHPTGRTNRAAESRPTPVRAVDSRSPRG